MGKKDLLAKAYFSDNKRFSDLFNYYLYDGKNVIKENDLTELSTESIFNDINRKETKNRNRDLLKLLILKTDNINNYLILGIENQTKADYEMVLRIEEYNIMKYRDQIKNHFNLNINNDKIKLEKGLIPIITIVIYYGNNKWDMPLDLYSYFNIKDKEILKYISNYKLNLISPYDLNDSDFIKMKSDIRILLEYLKYQKDSYNLKLLLNEERYKHVKYDTYQFINELTNSNSNIDIIEGDEVNMCKAINDLIKEGKIEGKKEGKEEATYEYVTSMHKKGMDEITISNLLDIDIKKVIEILKN